jgi:hypothetical protein
MDNLVKPSRYMLFFRLADFKDQSPGLRAQSVEEQHAHKSFA